MSLTTCCLHLSALKTEATARTTHRNDVTHNVPRKDKATAYVMNIAIRPPVGTTYTTVTLRCVPIDICLLNGS